MTSASITFKGQSVLVIGAAGGIGRATADAFEASGAKVLRPNRDELDITNYNSVRAYFDASPPFDHIVVAAAETETGSVADLELGSATSAMDSKFFGAYRVAKAARLKDEGSLTFLSGVLAIRPSADAVLQGAINAALEALAKGLALERAPARVNCVSPGVTDTPLYSSMPDNERKAMLKQTAARLPTKRVGQPENIAQAILFVAANPYVSGSSLLVDGGTSIAE